MVRLRETLYALNNQRHLPTVLLANTFDQKAPRSRFSKYFRLEKSRQVPTDEGRFLATKWGVPFFEIDVL